MDPQPYFYEIKKPKNENSMFTDLLSVVGPSGSYSKNKQRLGKVLERIYEYEPEMKLCELNKMVENFIISRKRYKKEAARLRLKITGMILMIPLIVYFIVTEMRKIYTTSVQLDELIPKNRVVVEMIQRVSLMAIFGFFMTAFMRIFVSELIYAFQSKLMNLYKNFKVMITEEKIQVYTNEISIQQLELIDLPLEDDPPIWNHQEALNQLNTKFYLLAIIPILLILVVPIIGQTIFFIRFVNGVACTFPLLAMATLTVFALLYFYIICFDKDKLERECDRIFGDEKSEE